MNYCIDFIQKLPILNQVEEINIKYNKNNTHIEEFLDEHKNQIINICLCNEEDEKLFIRNGEIEKLIVIREQKPFLNFKVRLYTYETNTYQFLKSKGIQFFFNIYIRDWDTLHSFINMGVSDVFITEEMGFQLDKVAEVAHQYDVNIRVFPDVAQSSMKDTPALKTFFIRPEDLELYENYIDVIEFWTKGNNTSIIYDVYKNDKKWSGKLNEIINNLDSDINSRYVIPTFGARRARCNKKCLKGNSCNLCNTIEELSKTLEENNLVVKKEDYNHG